MNAATRQAQVTFARFNSGVARAAAAYQQQPIAACDFDDCFNLVHPGQKLCSGHWSLMAHGESLSVERATPVGSVRDNKTSPEQCANTDPRALTDQTLGRGDRL